MGEPETGDYQIRPDQARKFRCGAVKVRPEGQVMINYVELLKLLDKDGSWLVLGAF